MRTSEAVLKRRVFLQCLADVRLAVGIFFWSDAATHWRQRVSSVLAARLHAGTCG